MQGLEPELPAESEWTPALKTPCGAFCTLEVQGSLRGCIGMVEPQEALIRIVSYCAVSASTRDDRFLSIRKADLPDMVVELSVLTPLQQISSVEEIEVGRHGLMMVSGHHHGLLLPQVPLEYGWDKRTFLEQTCRKAFLPTDAWKRKDVRIMIFEADVFSETNVA